MALTFKASVNFTRKNVWSEIFFHRESSTFGSDFGLVEILILLLWFPFQYSLLTYKHGRISIKTFYWASIGKDQKSWCSSVTKRLFGRCCKFESWVCLPVSQWYKFQWSWELTSNEPSQQGWREIHNAQPTQLVQRGRHLSLFISPPVPLSLTPCWPITRCRHRPKHVHFSKRCILFCVTSCGSLDVQS